MRMIKKLAFVLFVLITLNSCSNNKNSKYYLKTVSDNLAKVESATYFSITESFAPGDTAPSIHMDDFVKEYENQLDTTIGASFVKLSHTDTSQMTRCYDGKMTVVVDEDSKEIVLDSFKISQQPFRLISPPFFSYTKSIIKYALETKDSISIVIKEEKEWVYCCFTIFEEKQVEFFGKAYYIDNPYNFGEASKYEIWFERSTNLPFKYKRTMSHNINTETVSHVELNKLKLENFKASDYFMPDFAVSGRRYENRPEKTNDLIGKRAPDWVLKDVRENNIALKDLTSKVVMIQFTSVSCGPCRASIPFLNRLSGTYKKEDFDFVAIECTSRSLNALNNYQKRNCINYKFVLATKNVLEDYKINSFPVFFILDKEFIVRKVITGYGDKTTDEKIKATIDQMKI